MPDRIQEDLIFDLGLHKGFDAEYYLKKGFRVVGLEADPDLAKLASKNLKRWNKPWNRRLSIVNKALFDRSGEEVTFYTVPEKDDWGSLDINIAEKGIATAVKIKVETIDLSWMFEKFGVPRYIKCDMEGADIIFRDQLLRETRRPRFVSIEMNDGNEGKIMRECGYEVGQIVNQWMHQTRQPPKPPLEGKFVPTQFNGEMSGLFGRELPKEKWVPIDEIDEIYRKWKCVRDFDDTLAPGWVDLHVARRMDLK